MTVLEESIFTYLKTVSGITALVSTRIYPLKIKQGSVLPCITYQRISTPRELTHDISGKSGSLAHPLFQFDAWGSSYSEVKAISEALRDALNGKKATGFLVALVEDEAPEYDPNTGLYRSRSDFRFWHEE